MVCIAITYAIAASPSSERVVQRRAFRHQLADGAASARLLISRLPPRNE